MAEILTDSWESSTPKQILTVLFQFWVWLNKHKSKLFIIKVKGTELCYSVMQFIMLYIYLIRWFYI